MSAFFDRYLPLSERRTALWFVLAEAGVVWVASWLGRMIHQEMSIVRGEQPTLPAAITFVQVLAEFALVALLVALLIRLARAPKALALYLLLVEVVGLALVIVSLPMTMISGALFEAQVVPGRSFDVIGQLNSSTFLGMLPSLAIGLGAVAGAWIAGTVTLARIRDAGFSGDDSDTGEGLRRKPGPPGWGFLGWGGRPLAGDALIALALVAVTVIPSLAASVANLAMAPVPGRFEGGYRASLAVGIVTAAQVAAWFFSAKAVTRRSGVVSLWLVPAGALVSTIIFVLRVVSTGLGVEDWGSVVALDLSGGVLAAAAALLGSASALRAKPATLSATGQQGPGAQAPTDSAGGTDG